MGLGIFLSGGITMVGKRIWWREGSRRRSKVFPEGTPESEILEFKALIAKGHKMAGGVKVDMLYEDVYLEWLERDAKVHYAPATLAKAQTVHRVHLRPWYGDKRLSEIDTGMVLAHQEDLHKEGYAAQSVNNILAHLSSVLGYAVRSGMLGMNPVKGIKRIKRMDRDVTFWTFEEKQRFLGYWKEEDFELYQLVAFAVNTGLRPGELQGLLRDCLDFDQGIVTVKRTYCHRSREIQGWTKGRKNRRVPMSKGLMQIMGDKRKLAMSEPVFPYSMNSFGVRRLKPACVEAGVTPIRVHDLRHTFASHLCMRGVHVVKVMELMGHKKLETTMKYMHLTDDSLVGVTNVLDSEVFYPSKGQNVIELSERVP